MPRRAADRTPAVLPAPSVPAAFFRPECLPPVAANRMACCPPPVRHGRCQRRTAQHMSCALCSPVPDFRRFVPTCKKAPRPLPLSLLPLCISGPCLLRSGPSPGMPEKASGKKRLSPPLWGDFPMSASLFWGIFLPGPGRKDLFVKKITNKSSHLYRIFRTSSAERRNFRILLIPAAPPCA